MKEKQKVDVDDSLFEHLLPLFVCCGHFPRVSNDIDYRIERSEEAEEKSLFI